MLEEIRTISKDKIVNIDTKTLKLQCRSERTIFTTLTRAMISCFSGVEASVAEKGNYCGQAMATNAVDSGQRIYEDQSDAVVDTRRLSFAIDERDRRPCKRRAHRQYRGAVLRRLL